MANKEVAKEEGETKNIVILFSFPFCFYLTYLGISNNFKATHKISIFWLSYRCDTFFTINPLFICKSTSLFSPERQCKLINHKLVTRTKHHQMNHFIQMFLNYLFVFYLIERRNVVMRTLTTSGRMRLSGWTTATTCESTTTSVHKMSNKTFSEMHHHAIFFHIQISRKFHRGELYNFSSRHR